MYESERDMADSPFTAGTRLVSMPAWLYQDGRVYPAFEPIQRDAPVVAETETEQ